jgi:hypothetical protein
MVVVIKSDQSQESGLQAVPVKEYIVQLPQHLVWATATCQHQLLKLSTLFDSIFYMF